MLLRRDSSIAARDEGVLSQRLHETTAKSDKMRVASKITHSAFNLHFQLTISAQVMQLAGREE